METENFLPFDKSEIKRSTVYRLYLQEEAKLNPEMNEKQAFIFFVSDSPYEWQRNQEIFLFYLNRISVNEDDQCEIIEVKDVAYWDYDPWSMSRLNDDDSVRHVI